MVFVLDISTAIISYIDGVINHLMTGGTTIIGNTSKNMAISPKNTSKSGLEFQIIIRKTTNVLGNNT